MNGAPLTHLALLLLQLLSELKRNLAATKLGFWCLLDPRCVRKLDTWSWEGERWQSCAARLDRSSDLERGWKLCTLVADVNTWQFQQQENTQAMVAGLLLTGSGLFSCDALAAETGVSCYWKGGLSPTQECCFCLPPLSSHPHSPLIVPSITYLAFAWLPLWWSTSLSS